MSHLRLVNELLHNGSTVFTNTTDIEEAIDNIGELLDESIDELANNLLESLLQNDMTEEEKNYLNQIIEKQKEKIKTKTKKEIYRLNEIKKLSSCNPDGLKEQPRSKKRRR